MNKKLLTAAVAAALAAPTAMAEVNIYGNVHLATSSYDAEIDSGDAWDISSHQTVLGFGGSEDLGGSLKAVWALEFQIMASDADCDDAEGGNTTCNADGISNWASWVGLTGDWGTAVIGRHDTPLYISTASLDIFSTTIADYNGNGADDSPFGAGNISAVNMGTMTTNVASVPLMAGQGLGFVDLTVDQAIAYISPSFNGLTLAAAIVQPGMDRTTGASTSGDGFAEAYSVAALYSNGPFFASLAWERVNEDLVEELLNASAAAQTVLDDDTRWRLGLGYTANGMHVGFVFEDQDHPLMGMDAKRWQISGSYTFGNNVLKAMYGENEVECSTGGGLGASCAGTLAAIGGRMVDGTLITNTWDGVDVDQWAVGLDHNFSKRTKVYIVYTDVEVDQGQTLGAGESDGSWDGFSLGMVHNF